jgi:hypothetical protein
LILRKNKSGKICKAESSTFENKGFFLGRESPNLAKPRHPRVLQGSGPKAVKRAVAAGEREVAPSRTARRFPEA